MKQLLLRILPTVKMLLSVLFDALCGLLLTCAAMLAYSAATNGMYKMAVVAVAICVPFVILTFTYRRFLSIRQTTAQEFREQHPRILCAPRFFYVSMMMFEFVFALLAIHVTLFMNAPEYSHLEQVLSGMGYTGSITELCIVLRSLPAALSYLLVETAYVQTTVDLRDTKSVATAVEIIGSVNTVCTIQAMLTFAMWTVYAMCRYPGKTFNYYLAIKKAEESGANTGNIVRFRPKKK